MEPDRYTVGRIQQFCPNCVKIVTAMLVLGWLGFWQITDLSACNECGLILWDWAWHRPFTRYSDAKMPPKPVGQMRLF
jgi:hypothetical protein